MTITATQVLEMLSKAEKLGIYYEIVEDNQIQFTVYWFADEYKDYSYERVAISNKIDTFSRSYWGFDTWMSMLDERLEQKEEEELKEQKRQEVLARLTNEEKELLGVK